ncbi:uncharacterized protein LOC111268501 [Varroa jacobsoni]|uniref:uncharacterized protein LOC111268501 n=1 Tax=Varroa jacobsoni TaxID=62625 RepID=UPI000BF8E52A|nr:uncharacterized protein LOC111268501 [Varroa jacobsoni]
MGHMSYRRQQATNKEHCALCQLRGASRTVGSGLRDRSTQTMGVLFVRWKTLVKIEDATKTFETENGRESLQEVIFLLWKAGRILQTFRKRIGNSSMLHVTMFFFVCFLLQ